MNLFKAALSAVSVAVVMAGAPAFASTVIDGSGSVTVNQGVKTYTQLAPEGTYTLTPVQVVNGNCAPTGAAGCFSLSPNETSVLTFSGGAFDLTSIFFKLLGNAQTTSNALTIYETADMSNIATFDLGSYSKNTGYTESLAFYGVTSLTFKSTSNSNQGGARFDNLGVSAAVPLPAGGLLLLGGLGGLAGLKRRRKAA